MPAPDPAVDQEGLDDAERAVEQEPAEPENEFSEVLSPSTGGYVVVAIDVTEREELAADRERLFAIQSAIRREGMQLQDRFKGKNILRLVIDNQYHMKQM